MPYIPKSQMVMSTTYNLCEVVFSRVACRPLPDASVCQVRFLGTGLDTITLPLCIEKYEEIIYLPIVYTELNYCLRVSGGVRSVRVLEIGQGNRHLRSTRHRQ